MNFEIKSKKKLLFVSLSLSGGGAERVLLHIINWLDKDKYDIQLVILENIVDYQYYLDPSVKFLCLNKKNRRDFIKLIFQLRKVISDYKPDTIISFAFYPNIITIMAKTLTRKNIKLLISARNYPNKTLSQERLTLLKKWLLKITYIKADKIISVSESIKRSLETDYNIPSEKITTIYNPLALDEIDLKSNEEVVHTFFDHKGAKVVISVGRLVEQKRFDRLLRVFSCVKKQVDNVYLIILGKGEKLDELRDLASQLDISNYVDFVGFKPNPYAWIKRSDLFVLSSDYEGFPNVLVEAMACGIAVVSTDCLSGPGEIITHGKNGMLVPTGDEKALAEAMNVLLSDEQLRKNFSIHGKKRAWDFRIDNIARQYENLI